MNLKEWKKLTSKKAIMLYDFCDILKKKKL